MLLLGWQRDSHVPASAIPRQRGRSHDLGSGFSELVDVRIDSFNGGWGESTDLRVKDAVVTASDCRSFTTAEIKDVIKSGVAQTFACDNALRPDLESVTITPAGL
jgi:hypothetical protein